MSGLTSKPKMGPATKEEIEAVNRWSEGIVTDCELWKSLFDLEPDSILGLQYVLIRALRFGITLEALL